MVKRAAVVGGESKKASVGLLACEGRRNRTESEEMDASYEQEGSSCRWRARAFETVALRPTHANQEPSSGVVKRDTLSSIDIEERAVDRVVQHLLISLRASLHLY